MKLKFAVAVMAVSGLLAGCATNGMRAPRYVLKTPFAAADFAPWTGQGDGIVHGQAFLKTVGGEVRTCAGEPVTLLPATPYNLELVSAVRAHKEPIDGRDARADAYIHETVCDAQGNFSFAHLPEKKWIVWANVKWGVPMEYGISEQGGRLIREVDASPDAPVIILTAADSVD